MTMARDNWHPTHSPYLCACRVVVPIIFYSESGCVSAQSLAVCDLQQVARMWQNMHWGFPQVPSFCSTHVLESFGALWRAVWSYRRKNWWEWLLLEWGHSTLAVYIVAFLAYGAQHPVQYALAKNSCILGAGLKRLPGQHWVDWNLLLKKCRIKLIRTTVSQGFTNDEACIRQHLAC